MSVFVDDSDPVEGHDEYGDGGSWAGARRSWWECTCVIWCGECSHHGEEHCHEDEGSGTFGPCPIHPESEVVG